ncbi:hypothetical protein KTS45_18675 [Halomicroarcula limicola]|uniref:Uncharacterized protein n=1 Tax=Haloarcula limicola TaxID=1429915 RepID=A0A8J7YCQ8_9EURY|nr:hypothetical protein [Halomicroarcula limicola]MBV0926236.1 hypothetical protein [Halomicroarcula limicola]
MTASLEEVSTTVPITDGQSVSIEPGQPWPSAYRGSKYSLVSDEDYDDPVVKWKQRDLAIFTDPPDGLWRALALLGKSGGYGSFRVTADSEIITKVPADEYKHVEQAPVDSGWIPVYVGQLSGTIDFDEVDSDPSTPSRQQINVWTGFPFNHGERWSVSHEGTLFWKWRDYRFESTFDHSELVETYQSYRGTAGRLYLTEYGHIWVNVPKNDIAPGKEGAIGTAIKDWKRDAEASGNTATLRLVNRRLVATSRDDDPSTGHFPIHLGHLRSFDDGLIPKPVVDDPSYYQAVCEYEQVWE